MWFQLAMRAGDLLPPVKKGIFCDDSTFLCGAPVFFLHQQYFVRVAAFQTSFIVKLAVFLGGNENCSNIQRSEIQKSALRTRLRTWAQPFPLTDVQTRRRVRAYGSALLSVYPAACSLLIQRVTCVRTVSAPAELAGVMWSLGGFLSHRCGGRTKNVI